MATSRVRRQVITLLACLTGWPVESLVLARPVMRSGSGWCRFTQSIDSAQHIARAGWNSLSATLYLRRRKTDRSIDDGFVDLYVTPYPPHPQDEYEPVYDEAIASQLAGMRDQILRPVAAIIQEVLQEPTITLAYSGKVQWEADSTSQFWPDGYRFRLVVISDT
jgi:hypothetical protein